MQALDSKLFLMSCVMRNCLQKFALAHSQPELQRMLQDLGRMSWGLSADLPASKEMHLAKKKGDNCIKLREAFTWEISPAFPHLK